MFGDSYLNKLIASLESLRKFSKKEIQTQSKTFSNLEKWANESNNNNAIQDIANKYGLLVNKFEADFMDAKLDALSNFTNVFKKFQEYDNQLKRETKLKVELEKKEKKCFEKIKKCPTDKNLRDYEVKYEKIRSERQNAEMRIYKLISDIDTTKSILFKKNMKIMADALEEHAEAQCVLFSAIKDLARQIPDVTSEEVDDISVIRYKNQNQTEDICNEAKNKLTSISSSSLRRVANRVVSEQSHEQVIQEEDVRREDNITKIRVEYPSPTNKSQIQVFPSLEHVSQIYMPYSPMSDPPTPPMRHQQQQPPSYMASVWSSAGSSLPSAPCITEMDNLCIRNDTVENFSISKKALTFVN